MKRTKGFFKLFRSIHFKIPILFIVLLLAALQFIGVSFVRQLEVQMTETFTNQVSLQTGFLVRGLSPIMTKNDSDTLQASVAELLLAFSGGETDTIGVLAIDSSGYIVGSSNRLDQSTVGTRTTDSTVQRVLLSGEKATQRYRAPETNLRIVKTVVPIVADDGSNRVVGVLQHEAKIETIYETIDGVSRLFFHTSLVALAVTVVLAILVSRGLAQPILEIKERTERIAEGDYEGTTRVYGNDELGVLAEAINDLSVKIRDANESSESERQRLDSVLKHMSDGVVATDRRGRIIIVNDAALDLLRLEHAEVMGRSIMDVLRLNQFYTFRQLLETQDELILQLGQPKQEQLIVRGEFSVIQRESGFISGLVCVLLDITEQEQIERERREFVSNVSHELRTPLTSVKSYTDALSEGAWRNPDIAPEFLSVIQHETERMIRMIADLLDLSRMDAGKQELQLELVNMRDLFRSILERYDMLLRSEAYIKKDYRIRREFAAYDIWAEVDQDRITQVIDNIMNNAIKYSPDGGSIVCRLIEADGRVILSISDEGLGIPRKDLAHIFERFYRVDKARSREQGGTGLGLAISKEVVELHGGKIWVNSVENQGSTFFIALPVVEFSAMEEDWDA